MSLCRVASAATPLLGLLLVLGSAPAEPPKDSPKDEPTYEGKPLSAWLKQLRSDKSDEREKAADALIRRGQGGDALAAELLTAALNDSKTANPAAWRVLVTLGPDVVPVLTQSIWDKNPIIRGLAIRILGGIGPDARSATPALVHALRDESPGVQLTAIRSLADVEAYAAVPDLLKLLDDQDVSVRLEVLKSLIALGVEAKILIPALRKELNDKEMIVQEVATEVCARLGPEAAPLVADLVKADSTNLPATVQAIGPDAKEAVAALKKFATARPARRARTAAALWVIARDKDTITLLEETLKDEKSPEKLFAATALWQINQSPTAIDALSTTLKKGGLPLAEAVIALGKMRAAAKPAVSVLAGELSHPIPGAGVLAASALANIGPGAKEALPALATAAKSEDRQLAVWALIATCRIDPTPAAVEAVAACLKEKDATLRSDVANQLGLVGKDARAALPALKAALTDTDENVRRAAALAMWSIDRSPEALTALIALLNSPDSALRERVALELGAELRAEAAPAVPVLVKRVWDRHYSVRRVAAEALGRIGPAAKDAVPVLLALLNGDEPSAVQSAACEALGLIGLATKDAEAVLKRKLTHPNVLVRVHAALALFLLAGDKTGEKEAERGLGDRTYQVRITAAETLWRMNKDKRAVPLLLRAMTDSNLADDAGQNNEMYMAVRALGRVGPEAKAAVPELIRRLTHYDPMMARTAGEALKAIDPDAAKKAGVP